MLIPTGHAGQRMPSGAKIGIDSVYFDGLYGYMLGGRPARREA
jgi:hypothetical protein